MIRRLLALLGYVCAAPFLIVIMLSVFLWMLAIYVVTYPAAILDFRRWKEGFRRQERVISGDDLLAAEEFGTLIVDMPGFNGNTMCWWTTDRVVESSPISIPTVDCREAIRMETGQLTWHPFDVWCWEQYLSPENGKAKLVATRRGEAVAQRLQDGLINVDLVYSWSVAAKYGENPSAKQAN